MPGEIKPTQGELYHAALEGVRRLAAEGWTGNKSYAEVFGAVCSALRAVDSTRAEEWAAEWVWALVARRVLALVMSPGSSPNVIVLSSLALTEWGRTMCDIRGPFPGDPAKFIAAIRGTTPTVSDTTMLYLAEGVESLTDGHYIAAVVMLGCAAESEVDEIAELLLAKASSLALSSAEVSGLGAGMLWQRRKAINDVLDARKAQFPKKLRNRVEVVLASMSPLVAFQRNAAGHPTGEVVEHHDAYSMALLMPLMIKGCAEIRAAISVAFP